MRIVRLAPLMSLHMSEIRNDFPILSREHRGVPLIYLDACQTAAKTLKTNQSRFHDQWKTNYFAALH